MFDLPSAKRVRREELQSASSSPRYSPDPATQELLRSKIYNNFIFTTIEHPIDDFGNVGNSDEEETELRLFAAPSNNTSATHKIRLSSPDLGIGEPGFVVKKPQSYYLADEPTSEEESMLQAAAIDGSTVLELSRDPWPGCALPWKVQTISAAGMKKEVLSGHPPMLPLAEEPAHKRTRKNKKTRIAIRKKLHASRGKKEEMARFAKEKEEAEREKRTLRNREKKVKKKAREKAKKVSDSNGHEARQESETQQKDAGSD